MGKKQHDVFGGMSISEILNYFREDDSEDNKDEKRFSDEVLGGPMTSKEIEDFYRETKLKGKKGWKVKTTECVFSREHENYMCPSNYYWISATFVKVS